MLFKVKLNSLYDLGDRWEDDREYLNQTPMLLSSDLQKNNTNMIMFFEPEMTVNQCQWNAKDKTHTVELQHCPSVMRNLDAI